MREHNVLHRAWQRIREPRVVSALYGAWWCACLAFGAYSVVNPPRSVEHVAGDVLMMIIAGCFTLGGGIGVVSVALGSYWAERSAVSFVLLGFVGYVIMVGWIWVTGDGHRGLQMMALTGAAMMTALRLHWVGARPYSEERTKEIPTV